jgi:hypothetical protein
LHDQCLSRCHRRCVGAGDVAVYRVSL